MSRTHTGSYTDTDTLTRTPTSGLCGPHRSKAAKWRGWRPSTHGYAGAFPDVVCGWSGTSSCGKSLGETEMGQQTLVCIFYFIYLFFVMIYIGFDAYREAVN